MEAPFKNGDILIKKTGYLGINNTPFFIVRGITFKFPQRHKGKDKSFLLKTTNLNVDEYLDIDLFHQKCRYHSIGGGRATHIEHFRLATDEDYRVFEGNLKNIHRINTDDENQHISSISGEPKIEYNSEDSAISAAYSMLLKKGGEWVVYKCKVCGMYHIGKQEIK